MNLLEQQKNPALDFDMSKSVANTFDLGKAAGPMQDASSISVDDSMLASKQLNSILAKDNPLFEKARARAGAAAARRGLLNSSIAVEAGESAMIDAALPLAQQDASTNFNAAQFNTSARNDFARDANNFGRQGAMARFGQLAGLESDSRRMAFDSFERGADRSFQAGQNLLERNFRGEQAGLDRAQQRDLQSMDQQFRSSEAELGRQFDAAQRGLDRQQQVTLQQNSQEWQAAQQRLSQQFQMDFEKFRLPMNMMAGFQDRMQGFVTQIMSDPNLDAAAKDQAIKNYYAYSQQTMGWMSTFFGQSMPNMAGGPSIQPPGAPGPSAQQPGGVQTGGQGVGPGASIGVPPPMLSAVDGGAVPDMASPIVRIPDFSGMTPGDVYRSGDGELIRRYRESLR